MTERRVIYHGTPLTPRAALLHVCTGRAMCVSFFRPDDVEAVEAISPDIMFRQWRIFHVEGGAAEGRGMGRALGLVGLLRMAGASFISSGALGSDTRYAGSAEPAQRCAVRSVAFRAKGFTSLAHGCADRTAAAALRAFRPSVFGVDGRRKAFGQARVSCSHGRGCKSIGQSLACASHDAWHQGGMGLPFCQRRRNNTGTERVAV